ncbi:MAG: hypothetical protein EZS28_011562 [Streblomastix strix]|uniref:Uncharacterized protein n=1 Tax=Streblomastix strix TaxID=222440 RepID=A0A5J4WD51_9EUKA|nr:MAG: hypothetical protein EZS28_011562 [Streblomastix strix]
MSKNSIKPEPSEPRLFVNFGPPKFTARTPVTIISEQPEMGDQIGKFIQLELQPTLQDIERQLTPRQAISEGPQTLMTKVLQAMTGAQTSEINFWATNILDEQNCEAHRREIQCLSLLSITSITVQDEILDSKRSSIDKILQSEQALALYNIRISEGILAHLCEQQQELLVIDILSKMIYNLRVAERTLFARVRNEKGTNANYFSLAANSINSHLSSETESHMLGAQVIERSDITNKTAIRITNLMFGIQLLGKIRVKTKRFRQLTPSTIWKQIMRPMLNQNRKQALEKSQEIQITKTHIDMSPPNSGLRGQLPLGQGPMELYVPKNAVIQQESISHPAFNTEQEIPKIANGSDLIQVGKDDEGQYWPGFAPSVQHATDWRKPEQQDLAHSMDEVRTFRKEYNFDLRVACVRKEYDSENDSETLQPAKQQYKNLEFDSEDIEIDPYHHAIRDLDTTPVTEEVNRENDQDQEVIRDRETTKVQERLEWTSIEIRTDMKPGANREVEYEELLEAGTRITNEKKTNLLGQRSTTRNPLNWNRTHQYNYRNRGESWGDDLKDGSNKRIQMEKDLPENSNDRDSSWTEDDVPQHQIAASQPKQPAPPIQRIQQIHVQPKQQTTVQIPRQRCRKDAALKQDDIDQQEILQDKLAATQKEKEQYVQQKIVSPVSMMISTGMNKDKQSSLTQLREIPTQKTTHRGGDKQIQKKIEREILKQKTSKYLQQQGNNDINNMNVDTSDIQGTVGQLTGLQPSSCAQSSNLSAGLKLKETGLISANNKERTDLQINEGNENNAEEEEDEQTDEAALIQNKDYSVNLISQFPVQEKMGIQPQNNQGINTLSQMENDDAGPSPVGVQEKPKKVKGNKKMKIEGLSVSKEPNQSSNAQTQTKTASIVPKPKATPKKSRKKAELVKLEPKNSNDEDEEEVSPLIGQRFSNKRRSSLRSPSGIEKRSSLMRMAPQVTEERIGELIYKEKENGMGGKTKRFICVWKEIGKEDFIITGFYLRFKDQNSQ